MTKKALGLAQFNTLPEYLKFTLLHRDGVHVGKRIVEGQTVILLQLYSFYVEVYYKEYRKEIAYLISSESTELLTPYLDQINIKGFDKENSND